MDKKTPDEKKLVPDAIEAPTPSVADPRFSKIRIKKFVDFEPTTFRKLDESADPRLDQLIRLGLGDMGQLAFYEKALSDPRSAVTSAVYRDMVAESLSRLISLVLSDDSLYARVRQLLQARTVHK